ncbi:MAG: ribonuclease HII [Tissierellia bacterium]|nr:ribonuclease HII [Tissierellia bacterium]
MIQYSKYDDDIKKQVYKDYDYICGVDEVGRGPIAGPVLTCAVIMPKDKRIEGVTDSKKIPHKKLEILSEIIKKEAICYSYGILNSNIIDKINIKNATKLAMKMAVESLSVKPQICLIDAEKIDIPIKQLNIVKGDLIEYQISCASILAKVRRDEIMDKFDRIYKGYDFIHNKGYGTKKHYEALENLGETPIHRKSFLKKFYQRQMSFL